MHQEDSVFEQIMKQNSLKPIKSETNKLQVKPIHKKKLAQEQLSELDVQFKKASSLNHMADVCFIEKW